MAIYRKEWAQHGGPWKYRLDIVPYDTSLDGTVVNLGSNDVTVIELGALETKFDGLPYGLQSPPQMTIKMAISTLPSALQTALRNKYDNGGPGGKQRRNTFLFYTNRGIANTDAVFVDFAGTPAKINGNSYKYESGHWVSEIELVDCFHIAALNTPMSRLATMTTNGARLKRFADLPDFRGINVDSVSLHYDTTYDVTGFTFGFYLRSFEYVVNYAFQMISTTMNTMFSHQTVDAGSTADRDLNTGQMIGKTIGYFTSTSSYPRYKNTLLNSSTCKVISHIVTESAYGIEKTVGGLASTSDEVSWAKYETAWDWYKDLCECMAAKVSYAPDIETISTKKYLTYDWNVYPVRDHAENGLAINGNHALEMPEIRETEDGIGKAEARTTTFQETDVKEFKVNAGVMRADKQFTSQIMMHNMPVMPASDALTDETRDWIHYVNKGLYQTNRFCTKISSANEAEIVHTTVRIYDDASTYTDYEAIVDGVDRGSWIPSIKDDDVALQTLQLYINSVQGAGCTPIVIARHLTSTFGSDNVASVELKFRTTDYDVLADPATLGAVCDITSDSFTSAFPSLNWDKAILSGLQIEHPVNTITARFVLLA